MLEARCPTLADLSAFAHAGLAGARRGDVEEHLAACPDCSGAVAAFIEEAPALQAEPVPGDSLEAAAPLRYRLIRPLGTGGMGTVYEAEEVQSRRRVALKLAHELPGKPGQALLRRFFREARIAALLEHPNIVPVFDLGEFPDGTPYYTQRLIEGRSLSSAIAAAKGATERLALMRHFLPMCEAVAYAHRRGVLHRDIKSANAIVGLAGETWVIDWGLARVDGGPAGSEASDGAGGALEGEAAVTQAGATVGTPAYMSPEQARGEAERVDARADVWGLGAVLLEILGGKPPFAGLAVDEVLSRLRRGEGLDLSPLSAREAPPELAAIAARALAIDPRQRYPSAVELAADVNRWQLGRAVSAFRYGPLQRARLFLRQHPVLSAAAAVALLAGSGWALSLRVALERLRREHSDAMVQRGTRAMNALQWDRAAVDFALALDLGDRRDARLGLSLAGQGAPRPLWEQDSVAGVVRAVAFAGNTLVATAGNAGEAAAYDVASGGLLGRAQLGGSAGAAVACGDEVVLAAGKAVRRWRPGRGELSAPLAVGAAVRALAAMPDCSLLAVATEEGVRVLRPDGELLAKIAGDARGVAFDGRRLLWATRDALFVSADLRGGAPVELRPNRAVVALSAAAGRAALLLDDGRLLFYALGGPGISGESHLLYRLTTLALTPDGRTALGFDQNNGLWIVDAETGLAFAALAQRQSSSAAAAFSPDGRLVAFGSADRRLRVYDVSAVRDYVSVHPAGGAGGRDLDWSPAGSLLATAEEDGAIRLWDRDGPTPRAPLGRHPGPARAVRFSPDGSQLASAGDDGVRVWEVASGRVLWREEGSFRALAWLSNDALAMGLARGAVALRDASGWRELGAGPAISSLAAAPGGARFAAGDEAGAIRLYRADGSLEAEREGAHEDPVLALAFSPDGRVLASGGGDTALRRWDAAALAPLDEQVAYGGGNLDSLAFAPPGTPADELLLAGYSTSRIMMWSPGREEPALGFGLQSPLSPAVVARFSPDGRAVAAYSAAGALRIARLDAEAPGSSEKLLRFYKYAPAGLDVMRDEQAMIPPALRR